MNRILLILLGALVSLTAHAETRIRLDAVTASTTKNTDKKFKTDWGSYDHEIFRSRTVTATVACTLGEEKGTLIIQWIGRPATHTADACVVQRDETQLDLKPGFNHSEDFSCLFVENDAKYKALGIRDRSGWKYTAWIARVIDANGKVLAEQSSSPPLLKKFPADAQASRL